MSEYTKQKLDSLHNQFIHSIKYISSLQEEHEKIKHSKNPFKQMYTLLLQEEKFYVAFRKLLVQIANESIEYEHLTLKLNNKRLQTDAKHLLNFLIAMLPHLNQINELNSRIKQSFEVNKENIKGISELIALETKKEFEDLSISENQRIKIINLFSQRKELINLMDLQINRYVAPYEKEEKNILKSELLNSIYEKGENLSAFGKLAVVGVLFTLVMLIASCSKEKNLETTPPSTEDSLSLETNIENDVILKKYFISDSLTFKNADTTITRGIRNGRDTLNVSAIDYKDIYVELTVIWNNTPYLHSVETKIDKKDLFAFYLSVLRQESKFEHDSTTVSRTYVKGIAQVTKGAMEQINIIREKQNLPTYDPSQIRSDYKLNLLYGFSYFIYDLDFFSRRYSRLKKFDLMHLASLAYNVGRAQVIHLVEKRHLKTIGSIKNFFEEIKNSKKDTKTLTSLTKRQVSDAINHIKGIDNYYPHFVKGLNSISLVE